MIKKAKNHSITTEPPDSLRDKKSSLLIFAGLFIALFVLKLLFNYWTTNPYSVASRYFFWPPEILKSHNGRVNVLVLGKGGEGHDAGYLMDTIILASIPLSGEDSIEAISIPRDLWVPELKAKINSASYWAEQKSPGSGLPAMKAEVQKVAGLPVHYVLAIDFSAFKKLVDLVGGVEVNVQTAFVDNKFPIPGKETDLCAGDREYKCRYETVEFKEGVMHMDGETALKFARSRNAAGDEGTDIARGVRQQKILDALRLKLSDPDVFLKREVFYGIFEIVTSSLESDLPDYPTMAVLARKAIDAKGYEAHVIPEELLINPPISPLYDRQYVFIPRVADWKEIHDWVAGITNENLP